MHRLPPAGLQTWPIERECISRLTRAGLRRFGCRDVSAVQ